MGFSLERVLRQLSTQAGAPTPDPLGLFQQLWDTQNLSPGHLSDGPHCDSHFTDAPSGEAAPRAASPGRVVRYKTTNHEAF